MPADNPTNPSPADTLEAHVAALLADPAHHGNPLRSALADLFEHSQAQRGRLERLIRISDGFHILERSDRLNLADEYDRQLRRIEKIVRISDRYQHSLRELSESLKDAALRDPLTDLGNRRFLMERMKEETERCARSGAGYALAIADVDHFKTINDRFGHEAGDAALSRIAGAMRANVRNYDLCGRWGGEEFLIIFPDTDLDTAASIIGRVRHAIATLAYPGGDNISPLSASFGLTVHNAGEPYSTTLSRADRALFAAKANGRNRCECM